MNGFEWGRSGNISALPAEAPGRCRLACIHGRLLLCMLRRLWVRLLRRLRWVCWGRWLRYITRLGLWRHIILRRWTAVVR